MASAKIDLSVLKSELGATKEEIIDLLFELGIEPEEEEGEYLWVDITPDRPDLFSTYGILRLLKGFYSKERAELRVEKGDYRVIVDKQVLDIRPCAAFLVCRGLEIDEKKLEEIIQLQEKIHATFGRRRKKASIGFYKLGKIEFPVKYTALPPQEIRFVPLDGNREMSAEEILQEHPKGVEYGHLIKGFDRYPILIDNKGDILSLPPIINAEDIGRVEPGTTDVFVDVTGTHWPTVLKIIEIIGMTLREMGGTVYSVEIQYPDRTFSTPSFNYERWELSVKKCCKLIGIELSSEKIAELLRKMDYRIVETGSERLVVEVPSYRVDIMDEVDIIDDVARAYGFNRMEPKLPTTFYVGKELPRSILEREVASILIGLGFNEVYTFALTTVDDQLKKMGIDEKVVLLKEVKVAADCVRRWLLPEVLKSIAYNKGEKKPIKVFEVSDVVIPQEDLENRAENRLHLCAAIYGRDAGFTEIRQVLEYLLDSLGIEYSFKEKDHPSFIPGRCAAVIVNGKEAGLVGEISPKVLTAFKLEYPVAAFEIDLSVLL